MVFSASYPTAALDKSCNYDPFYFLKRHLAWLTIGFGALIFAFKINLRKLRKYSQPIVLFAIVLLVLVLIPAFSREVLGARRSLIIGSLTFQPSEFAKIALIFYLADALARKGKKVSDSRYVLWPFLVCIIVIGLIEKQPDLGTTIILGGAVIGVLYMAGVNIWHLMGVTSLGFVATVLRIMSHPYRLQRILAFFDPWKYQSSLGYQVTQSFIALGSGGLYGLGLGESRQKFFYLPERFTDFIFAIIGEELGLIYGTIPVILLFMLILYKGLRVSANTRNTFLSLLGGGITFQIVLQALVNIAVVTGALPCTGIPLPMVSFGGSSLVFTMFGIGLLLNIAGEPRRLFRGRIDRRIGSHTNYKPRETSRKEEERLPGEADNDENADGYEKNEKVETVKCVSSLQAEEPGATYIPR